MAGLDKIVTDELVFAVADRLSADGSRVSNRSIWSEIGGGSMTTVAAALRRWRAQQTNREDPPVASAPLPDAVGLALREAVDRLWIAAQAEAQKDVERLSAVLNKRVAEATAERDDGLAELQATVEEIQRVQKRASDLEADLAASRQDGDALRIALTAALDRASTADARVAEISRRADDLNTELGRVHEAAAGERERLALELTTLRAAHDQTKTDLAEVRAKADEAAQQVVQLSGVLIERDQLGQELRAAREEIARRAGQIETMATQHAELLRAVGPPKEAGAMRKKPLGPPPGRT